MLLTSLLCDPGGHAHLSDTERCGLTCRKYLRCHSMGERATKRGSRSTVGPLKASGCQPVPCVSCEVEMDEQTQFFRRVSVGHGGMGEGRLNVWRKDKMFVCVCVSVRSCFLSLCVCLRVCVPWPTLRKFKKVHYTNVRCLLLCSQLLL